VRPSTSAFGSIRFGCLLGSSEVLVRVSKLDKSIAKRGEVRDELVVMSRPCTDIINVGMFRLRQLTKEQEGGWGMPISIYMIGMQCSTPCISPCSVLSPAYKHASNVATG
jgi:hypothetical protein